MNENLAKKYDFNPQKYNPEIEWEDMEELRGTNRTQGHFVSVSTRAASSRIYISAMVSKMYLKDYKYAKIGFDWENKVLAIKPVDDYNPKVAKFASGGGKSNSPSMSITYSGLLDKIVNLSNQEEDTVVRYPVVWNDDIKTLLVFLGEPQIENK